VREMGCGGSWGSCLSPLSITLPTQPQIEGRAVRDPFRTTSQGGGCDSDSVCWLLQLTCLAPDLVEAILNGRQPRD
jgi:hypothetical protein